VSYGYFLCICSVVLSLFVSSRLLLILPFILFIELDVQVCLLTDEEKMCKKLSKTNPAGNNSDRVIGLAELNKHCR